MAPSSCSSRSLSWSTSSTRIPTRRCCRQAREPRAADEKSARHLPRAHRWRHRRVRAVRYHGVPRARASRPAAAAGTRARPELLTKTPRGTFPVLTDGAIVVFEPFAIMEYLEHAHTDPPLLPGTNALRALALTRLHEVHNLAEVCDKLFSYLSRTRGKDLEPSAVYALADALHDELFFWEYYYGIAHWAAGTELTFADLAVFVHMAAGVH